ncbi:hypothetical protein SRB17_20210 [Streptomyces sp. RB17]|nr:hypothetical protein [Streptomyces sp. RB17]
MSSEASAAGHGSTSAFHATSSGLSSAAFRLWPPCLVTSACPADGRLLARLPLGHRVGPLSVAKSRTSKPYPGAAVSTTAQWPQTIPAVSGSRTRRRHRETLRETFGPRGTEELGRGRRVRGDHLTVGCGSTGRQRVPRPHAAAERPRRTARRRVSQQARIVGCRLRPWRTTVKTWRAWPHPNRSISWTPPLCTYHRAKRRAAGSRRRSHPVEVDALRPVDVVVLGSVAVNRLVQVLPDPTVLGTAAGFLQHQNRISS